MLCFHFFLCMYSKSDGVFARVNAFFKYSWSYQPNRQCVQNQMCINALYAIERHQPCRPDHLKQFNFERFQRPSLWHCRFVLLTNWTIYDTKDPLNQQNKMIFTFMKIQFHSLHCFLCEIHFIILVILNQNWFWRIFFIKKKLFSWSGTKDLPTSGMFDWIYICAPRPTARLSLAIDELTSDFTCNFYFFFTTRISSPVDFRYAKSKIFQSKLSNLDMYSISTTICRKRKRTFLTLVISVINFFFYFYRYH